MKRFLLFLLVLGCKTYSQNLIVKYDYYYKKADSPIAYARPSELLITPTSSLYKIFGSESQTRTQEVGQSENGEYIVIKENKNRYYYKDLKENTVYSTEKILTYEFFVKDSLSIFHWELTSEAPKVILGYACNQAKLNYRGRNYVAYYTQAIAVQNGPYKFHGLPGLLLSIECLDDSLKFSITAKSIEKSDKPINISNPFLAQKIIGWNDFTRIYKEKYEEVKNYNGNGEVFVTLPKGKIELIIPE